MHADISLQSFQKLQIDFGQPSLYHIDGEPAPEASQIDIEVQRRTLQLLTPRT